MLQLHLHTCKMQRQGLCAGLSPSCSCSSCSFSPCPRLCLWCLITTSYQWDFWHIHMFGIFFFPASCLPLSFTGSFLKKCNLSVSEMPVLVKPPRSQALLSITPCTLLFMTHQNLPGSPQVTGTFTHSYQPLRA